MQKRIPFVALYALVLFALIFGNHSKVQASEGSWRALTQYTMQSPAKLDYKNYDQLFKKVVWNTGPSNRKYAFRPWLRRSINSRIGVGNPNPTRLEANRVFYHILTEENLRQINELLADFQHVADDVPLQALSKNEQVAYWINLHNLAVLRLVAENYHVSSLKKLYRDFAGKKSLKVQSVPLSLDDIGLRILPTIADDPLVVFGLFYGAVGSPNIRSEAYTGDDLYRQLENNAEEFVNSLRGIRFRSSSLLVSEVFDWYSPVFFEDQQSILRTLRRFAKGEVLERLEGYRSINYANFDWYVADLFNGNRPSQIINHAMPDTVLQLLENVRDRNLIRTPTVEVEEVYDSEEEPD